MIYAVRVYLINGWFIVTYGLGIYLLNNFIGFLSPQVREELFLFAKGREALSKCVSFFKSRPIRSRTPRTTARCCPRATKRSFGAHTPSRGAALAGKPLPRASLSRFVFHQRQIPERARRPFSRRVPEFKRAAPAYTFRNAFWFLSVR